MTAMLRRALESEGFDVADFCNLFAEWKTNWPQDEYAFWFFGKDGLYAFPKRQGESVLHHVHLPPENRAEDLARWNLQLERLSRKVSDTALVYTFDPRYGYLLLYVAREPNGHALSDMSTQETHELMNGLADQAEAFRHGGSVYL